MKKSPSTHRKEVDKMLNKMIKEKYPVWKSVLLIGGVIISLIVLVSYMFMILWNFTMPYIFNLPVLNIYQAFALSFLIGLIIPRK